MALGILAFDTPVLLPEKYVWTNGDVCIIAETAEMAAKHWWAAMDRPYRGGPWVVAVDLIRIETPRRIYVSGAGVPTVKLPRGWVDAFARWGGWLTGGQERARTLPEEGGTLDGVPGRAE